MVRRGKRGANLPNKNEPGRPKKEEENNEFKEAKKAMDEIKNSR